MLRTDLPVLTTLEGRDVTLRSFDMGRYTVHASLPEFARIAMAPDTGTASGFSGYYHLQAPTHPLGGPVPRLSADERRPWPWLPELNPFLIAAHSSEKDQLCLVVDGMQQPVADPAVGSWLRVLPQLSTPTRPLQDPLAILTCNQGAAHQQLADSLGRLVWFPHGETDIWGERDSVGRHQLRVGLHRTQDGHGGQFRSTYPQGPAGDRVRWAYRSQFGSNPTRWLVERSAPPGSPIPVGLRPHPLGGNHVGGLSYFDRRDWRSRSPALNASVLGSSHVAWTPNDAYQPGTPAQTDPATGSPRTTALPWRSGKLGELPIGLEDVAVVVSYFAGGRFAVYDERHDLSYWETPLSFGLRLRKDLAAAGEPAHRPIPSRVLLLTDYEAVPDVARWQVARGLRDAKLITVNTPSTLFLDEDSEHGVATARIALLPPTGGVTRPVWTATTPAGTSTSLPPASRHHTGGALSAGSALRSTYTTGTPHLAPQQRHRSAWNIGAGIQALPAQRLQEWAETSGVRRGAGAVGQKSTPALSTAARSTSTGTAAAQTVPQMDEDKWTEWEGTLDAHAKAFGKTALGEPEAQQLYSAAAIIAEAHHQSPPVDQSPSAPPEAREYGRRYRVIVQAITRILHDGGQPGSVLPPAERQQRAQELSVQLSEDLKTRRRRSAAPPGRGRGEQDQQDLAASDGAESSRVALDAEGTPEQMASHSRGDNTGSQLSSHVVRASRSNATVGYQALHDRGCSRGLNPPVSRRDLAM